VWCGWPGCMAVKQCKKTACPKQHKLSVTTRIFHLPLGSGPLISRPMLAGWLADGTVAHAGPTKARPAGCAAAPASRPGPAWGARPPRPGPVGCMARTDGPLTVPIRCILLQCCAASSPIYARLQSAALHPQRRVVW
jgi:hypothetical protein